MPTCISAASDEGYSLVSLVPSPGNPPVDGYYYENVLPQDLNIVFTVDCTDFTGFYCNITDPNAGFLIYTSDLQIYQVVTPNTPFYFNTYLAAGTNIIFEKLTAPNVSDGGISGYVFQGYYEFPTSPTPTPSASLANTPTPTRTPFPSNTGPTATPRATNLPTPSPTPSPSPSRTATPTPTMSGTPTPTPTISASVTPSPTMSGSPSPTPRPTRTPSPSPTTSPTPTSTNPTSTPTLTPSVTPSPTPSGTNPTPTVTPSQTPAGTLTPVNGYLYAFGYNFYGQLGNNSYLNSATVVQNTENRPVWNKIAESHGNSNAAIQDDGTLWVWGFNYSGLLGTNNGINYSSPVQTTLGGNLWRNCSTSIYNLAAIDANGRLFISGDNAYGQFGNNNTVSASTLVQTATFTTWKWVTSGYQSIFAISSNNKLWATGKNLYGQLGDGTLTNRSSWVQVVGNYDWISLDNDSNFTIGLRSDNTVWVWGSNGAGQLGQNKNVLELPLSNVPLQVFSTSNWQAVTAGYGTSYAIRNDGTLWAWGLNNSGQVGNSSTNNISSPVQIGTDTNWSAIGAGLQYAVGLKTDGSIWTWGRNDRSQLGNVGTQFNISSPVQSITTGLSWTSISAGLGNTSLLTNVTPPPTGTTTATPTETPTSTPSPTPSGTMPSPTPNPTLGSSNYLSNWGDNTYGQLGNNTTGGYSDTPVSTVKSSITWSKTFCGPIMGAGIDIYGNIWTYGSNAYGNLGNDSSGSTYSSPVQVIGGGYYISAAVGNSCLALRSDFTMWSWGGNAYGQLGDSTVINKSSPVQIAGSWKSVSVSPFFSAAIDSNNKLYLWGDNSSGQLGVGNTVLYSSPVQEMSNSDWLAVSVNGSFAAAIRSDYTMWLWGNNANGQLGISSGISQSSPVQEMTESAWTSLSCFANGVVGIKLDGTLWAWGANEFGQLGDNTVISKSTPVQNNLGGNTWNIVSCGLGHTVAKKTDGSFYVWGYNSVGQLGLDNLTDTSVPTQISYLGITWGAINAGGYNSSAIYLGLATPTPTVSPTPTPSSTEPTPTPTTTEPTATPTGTASPTPSPTPTPSGTDPTPSPTASSSPTPTPTAPPPSRLWLFGYNYFGQIGNNSNVNTKYITRTAYPDDNWYTGAVSKTYASYALKEDNSLWCWGDNEYGQLSTNDVIFKSTPVQIFGGGQWTKVTGGVYHAAGIKKDGSLWSWGGNSYGCLGVDVGFPTILSVSSPVQEITNSTWIDVAAGFDFTLGIKSNNTLWGWGLNTYNQIGDGRSAALNPSFSSPVQEWYQSNAWKTVVATAYSAAALKLDGTLWSWGNNFYGQLAINTNLDVTYPNPVGPPSPPPNWRQISGGFTHLAAIKGDFSLWLWGLNDRGQLGDGTKVTRSSMVQVLGGGLWLAVAAGYNFTAAIKIDNSLWTWGANEFDSLGNISSSGDQSSPCLVSTSGIRWYQVLAGMHHTAVLTFNLGPTPTPTQTPNPTSTPTATPSPTPSPTIAPVPTFGTQGGQLWMWGDNTFGQIGDDTTVSRSSLVQTVAAGNDWNTFSKRYTHSAATKDDGTLWVWGQNTDGALGTLDVNNYSSPVQTVATSTLWATPYTGNLFTLALKQDGSLWSWGRNNLGQLGDLTTVNKSSPVQILPTKTVGWLSAGAGKNHGAAVGLDGTLWCWGDNSYGQLGTNNLVSTSSPVQTIIGGLDWSDVSCGQDYTLALKKDGTIWGFGKNNYGQYGDTTTSVRSAPVLVAAGWNYWFAVTAGNQFAAALAYELIPTPTASPTPSPTMSPSPTPSGTQATPTPTASATITPTPTNTNPTQTPTPTVSGSPTPTPSSTAATPTPTVTPSPTYDPDRELDLNIWYRVYSVFNKEIDIHYQLGALITYAWRVETECRPLVQPLAPFTDEQQKCPGRTIMTIFATSVTDVCRQINASQYITKVSSIQKYTKPVYSLEEEYLIAKGEYDPRDVRYVPVPFCDYSACKDLCVDYLMEEQATGTMWYNPPNSVIVGGGSLKIFGSGTAQSNNLTSLVYLQVNGAAGVIKGSSVQETLSYRGSGGLIVFGEATISYPNYFEPEELALSNFSFEGLEKDQTVIVEGNTTIPILQPPTLQRSETVCKCQNIPLQLNLNTNLTVTSLFTNFLSRNNISFNPTLTTTFNINTKEWTASYTYTSKYDAEKWLVVVNLNCNNDLDDFDLEPVWTLTFLFRQTQNTGKTLDTLLQTWIPANQLCPASTSYRMGFSLAIDVINSTCIANNNVVLPNLFLNDGIGLFKSSGWNNSPILNITGAPAS